MRFTFSSVFNANSRRLVAICILLHLSIAGTVCPAANAKHEAQSSALNYAEPVHLTGAIYASKTRRLLFRFTRVATQSAPDLKVQRDFTYPDGRLAAREKLLYNQYGLVSYDLEETQTGATGTAKIQRSANTGGNPSIHFEYTSQPGARAKMRTERLRENVLVADMVGPFLASHWDALNRGENVNCRYIVLPRLETVGFTFSKQAESVRQGQRVLNVRMAPTSPILATLVNPLLFSIEEAPPHRVLAYEGRTTPKIRAGSGWADLDDAVSVFDWLTAR